MWDSERCVCFLKIHGTNGIFRSIFRKQLYRLLISKVFLELKKSFDHKLYSVKRRAQLDTMAFDHEEELGNMSLDGRSLIVPDYGDVDDMSSLGGNSKLTYRDDSPNVNYVGDKKTVERSYDVVRMSSLEKKLASYHADPELQSPDYGVDVYDNSPPEARNDTEFSQSFEKDDDKKDDKKRCLPQWLYKAPLWLKIIIIASVALLIGAAVLVVAGAILAKRDTVSSSAAEESKNGEAKPPTFKFPSSLPTSPTFDASANVPMINETPVEALTEGPTGFPTTSSPTTPQTISPTAFPTTSAPTTSPSYSPTTAEPTIAPTTLEPTRAPTTSPTANPTATPTLTPTPAPNTKSPTPSPTQEMINFFVMGGRFEEEEITGLESLPKFDGNTILVHLGDWNSPYTTLCSEDSFTSNAESYQKSTVPVYFVPGDNEYNGKSSFGENLRYHFVFAHTCCSNPLHQ